MLKKLLVLSFGVGLSLTSSAGAQEHNLPALNAFGRFWGIGWSNGYHSGAYDGRFQHVKESHPAAMYGSNALLYPYQPGYEPQRPSIQASQGYSQPVYSNVGESQMFGSILQQPSNQMPQGYSGQAAPTPPPVVPPKPVEPPPTWLRPFLKDDAKEGAELPKPKSREELEAEESSPSDQLSPKTDSPKPAKQEPAKREPAKREPAKQAPARASDEDDLLTLSPPKSPIERFNEARRKQGSNR